MAQVVADRVRDTTTTTGTGAVTVSGTAPATYLTFSARCSTNDTLAYFIAHQSADEWEVGIGTYSASNTLTRTTVLSSSNADAAVSFSAGTKDVVLTQVADRGYQKTGFTGLPHIVTTSVPALNLSQEWNAGAIAFTAIKLNVTKTASAITSLLLDLQSSGTSLFKIDQVGSVLYPTPDGNGGIWAGNVKSGPDAAIIFHSSTSLQFIAGASTKFWVDSTLGPGGLQFGCGVHAYDPDVFWTRDAANSFAIRNIISSTAQRFRIYNSYDNVGGVPSNYESGGFDWITTSNVFRIRSENLGTGTNRIIAIDGFAKAGAAVAGDIPTGTWALVRDTSGSTTKLIYNNAGTLMTVALT